MIHKDLVELNSDELKNTEGGILFGAAAVAAGCGLLLGAFVVGAVVAYGTCWALNKLVTR